MAMMRWNPMRDMFTMQRAIDRLFDETWRAVRDADADVTASALALDIHETETGYRVAASLPGISADQIAIQYHDGVLTISGDLPQFKTEPEDKSRALITERVWGKFSRSIRLPQPVDADAIEAGFENGVLTLTLPKSQAVQPRLIPIRTASGAQN